MKIGPDMKRMLSLARREQGELGELSPLLKKWSEHLFPVQLEALSVQESLPKPMGLWGDIPVGEGKSLIAYLLPRLLDIPKALVLTKAKLVKQAPKTAERFKATFPEVEGYEPVYESYSRLAHKNNARMLHELRPGIIILDEAHSVLSSKNTSTKRLFDYVET